MNALLRMQIVLAAADTVETDQLKKILTDLEYRYTCIHEPGLLTSTLTQIQPEVVFIAESFLQTPDPIDIDALKCLSHHGGFATIMIADRLGEYISGVDEILPLPLVEQDVLMKLDVAVRSKNYHLRLAGSYQDKEKELHILRREANLTERMLSRIIMRDTEKPSGVRLFSLPKLHVSGDVAIFWDSPEGNRFVMVGDVTGHGLSSAVAVMAIRSIFMEVVSQKNLSLAKLASTLNNRIYEILPDEMFFTASLIKVAGCGEKIEVWNAAMPDILVLDPQQGEVKGFPSVFMPLGILPFSEEDIEINSWQVNEASRLYLFSDGFTDHYEASGEEMNRSRLLEILRGCQDPTGLFQALLEDFHRQRDDEVKDDVTVVEVTPFLLGREPSFVI